MIQPHNRAGAATKKSSKKKQPKNGFFAALSGVRNWFKPRTKPPSFIASVVVTTFWMLTITVTAIGLAGGGLVLGIAKAYVESTPTLDVAMIEDQDQTSFIYDRNGNLITAYSGLEYRVWASIDEMPKHLTDAFVAIEDARFYTHNGIDIKRIAGVFLRNLANDTMQGGSTITQQLVKNTLLTDEQTYRRKLQEAYLAMELERTYTKDEILEFYMNTILLGDGNYGVKTAAQDYFGKELSQLSLRECATIAGLARNPSRYSPRKNYVTNNTPDITDDRTEHVLAEMLSSGFITQREYDAALKDTIAVVETSERLGMYDMPYFVEYAVQDVIKHFLRQRGLVDNSANRSALTTEIRNGGYRIHTTVDPTVQIIVEETLRDWAYPELQDPNKAEKAVKVGSFYINIPQPQAAATVVDYRTGELIAIVGGRETPIARNLLNRATDVRMNMPMGSSIKPITVYGPALDKGLSPGTPMANVYATITGWDHPRGYPTNYSANNTGPQFVSMRTGLQSSYNVVAARTMMEYVGVQDAVSYLTSMGVDPSHIQSTPFGMSLGSSGLTTLEMAACYGTIANKGQYIEPVSFSHVEDAHGNVLLDMRAGDNRAVRQVYQPSTAYMLTDMLISSAGSAARIKGITVGGKTGTNSEHKGVTYCGVTPHYAAAVWVGHDDYAYALKSDSTGARVTAPLWNEFMTRVYEELELENGPIIDATPESLGLIKVEVCGITGLLATDACRADTSGIQTNTDWFTTQHMPTVYCNAHQLVDTCLESLHPAGMYCPTAARTPRGQLFLSPETYVGTLDYGQAIEALPLAIHGIEPAAFLSTVEFDPFVSSFYCPIHNLAWSLGQAPVASPTDGYDDSQHSTELPQTTEAE